MQKHNRNEKRPEDKKSRRTKDTDVQSRDKLVLLYILISRLYKIHENKETYNYNVQYLI